MTVKMNTRLVTSSKSLKICNLFRHPRRKLNQAALSEYSDEPEYPPIFDNSKAEKERRERESWHNKVTNLPTVEQKFMELNMPRYYGYKSVKLQDARQRINGAPFIKYITRTRVEEGFPHYYYDDVKNEADMVAATIQDEVNLLIDMHFNINRPMVRVKCDKSTTAENFFFNLHRILNAALSPTVDHIKESMIDLNPRIEAFWFVGGFKLTRFPKYFTEEQKNMEYDCPIQGSSSPTLGIRGELGLPEVVGLDHPLATDYSALEEILDPRAYNFPYQMKPATITTGFWPGQSKEHCRLWLHNTKSLDANCKHYGDRFYPKFLQQKMIISSFCQALAHASYLGFGPLTELTYPIVQQSVLSDGQKWNFSLYQLNTCALHSERAKVNPVNNILWLNSEEHLFEAVDDTGIKGFNLEVLSKLVAMYMKKGIQRQNATPYLAPYKYLANHPAKEEYKEEFHKYLLQNILSGRPRHLPVPEVNMWEKIYKRIFQTRPIEAKRRFFEDHYNKMQPKHRRLDEYSPIYIPKPLQKEFRVKYKPLLDSENLYSYDKTEKAKNKKKLHTYW